MYIYLVPGCISNKNTKLLVKKDVWIEILRLAMHALFIAMNDKRNDFGR